MTHWTVGKIAIFEFLITDSSGGVIGQTPTCIVKRQSDGAYWDGIGWIGSPTLLPMVAFNVTDMPGLYIYSLIASALTEDDTVVVYCDNTLGLPKSVSSDIHQFDLDEAGRVEVTEVWGDIGDPLDYGGGSVTDGMGTPISGVTVRAIDENANIATESATDALGEWRLFLIPGPNLGAVKTYTIEFHKPGFTKADVNVKLPSVY